MRHIGPSIRQQVEEKIISLAEKGRFPSEITAGGITFLFQGNLSTTTERIYTGVEHLGERESFLKERTVLSGFFLSGTYDESGEEIRTDLDPRDLELGTDSDSFSLSVRFRYDNTTTSAAKRFQHPLRRCKLTKNPPNANQNHRRPTLPGSPGGLPCRQGLQRSA